MTTAASGDGSLQCPSTHIPPAWFTGGEQVTLRCSRRPGHGGDHAAMFGGLRVEWDDAHAVTRASGDKGGVDLD